MVGCENKSDVKSLNRFLKKFEIIQLNSSISEIAENLFEKYRLSHGVLIPDMLIASTAISQNLPLMTKNRKDFRFIDSLELVDYRVG